MIRITYLLRKQAQLSIDEFRAYWKQQHGPLVASVATQLGLLRYVQVHALDDPVNAAMAKARGGMEAPYDGVAEIWFASRLALAQSLASEDGKRASARLLADEANFIDLPSSTLWLGYEYPQINPAPENLLASERSGLAKLYFPLRATADHSDDDAQFYWRTHHGPIIRRDAAASGILRYMQVHRAIGDELDEPMRTARGCVTAPYLGHAEVWLDRARMSLTSPERKAANARAIEDESGFIDFRRSAMWLGKEHCVVDNR